MIKNIKYIFVDLDGTLVRTDLFFESIIKRIKQNPLSIFQIITWLMQGRSVSKEKLAKLVTINPEYLPYETELIDYLKEQKKNKTIILATASNQLYANSIAEHLGIFDKVIASDKKNNLKGRHKLSAILKITGNDSFIYAGDSKADRPIWQDAQCNIFVNAPQKNIEEAKLHNKAEKIIKSRSSIPLAFINEMRIHQWAKNFLIFVPLFTSHNYLETTSLISTTYAFLCFSFCASGVYFLNDMLDLDADRFHKSKRYRPLASGNLPLSFGFAGAFILPIVAFGVAWLNLPSTFLYILLFYYLVSNTYSFILKRISSLDVMTLAILYTLRIVAGAEAINVVISSWLVAFSVFVFVSLAYLKRYIEISTLTKSTEKTNERGYFKDDAESMFSLGVANMTASVVILSFYINSAEVASLYKNPKILWGLCWLMLYWGNRIWIAARRGNIHDDPVVFAIKDNISRLIGLGFLIVVISAKYLQI